MYYELTTTLFPGSLSEYQNDPINGDAWADDEDLAAAMACNCGGDLYELGRDSLPAEVDDIRGRIRNESDRVFAAVYPDGSVRYFGITGTRNE